MNQLPNHLQNLVLDFSENNLGGNFKYLPDIIRNLPNNLGNLTLYLTSNNLGENPDNFKYLT